MVVSGRPLQRGFAGALVAGDPVRVAVSDGRIAEVDRSTRSDVRADVGGPDAVLAPALSDSHVHLLAAASARTGLDLAVDPPRSVETLLARIRARARGAADGAWLIARGYDEFHLGGARPPTAAQLDEAAPGRLVRIRHATLHASLLSTAAMARLPSSLREAAEADQGLLVGHEETLSRLCGERDEEGVGQALRELGEEFVAAGVACVEDITASNDAGRVRTLARAVEHGWLPQRLRVWLRDADEAPAARAAAGDRAEIAGVKLLARDAEEPAAPDFRAAVARARAAGLPVAVHAVEPDVIDAALDALRDAPARSGSRGAPDRLEHCSLCPPHLVERLAASRVAVVTQPGFLVARGPKYRREVEEPLWPWLYPVRSWLRAGILVAAGSDAPVIPTDPRLGFAGATTRRSSDGTVFGDREVVTEADALELCTGAAGRVRGDADAGGGWLRPGARADFALLAAGVHGLRDWRAATTIIGGRVHHGSAS